MAFALAAARLCLPFIVCDWVNAKLKGNPDYQGRAGEISISLWRGAYQIRSLVIEKREGGVAVPFLSCPVIDLSLEWKALLHGSIVGKVFIRGPVVNFVKGPTEAQSQAKVDRGWERTAQELMPLTVNRFIVQGGEIHYRDFNSQPKVDIVLSSVSVAAANLSTIERKNEPLPAEARVRAACFGSGSLNVWVALNPLKQSPTFELKETLRGVELAKLNDFFAAYAKFKVKGGTFELYSEVAGKDGRFVGYAKPIIHGLEVDKTGHANPTLAKKLWAGVSAVAGRLLSNPKKDQVATRIPINGTFGKTEFGVWSAIGGLLKNAFVQAVLPSLNERISLDDVKPRKPAPHVK